MSEVQNSNELSPEELAETKRKFVEEANFFANRAMNYRHDIPEYEAKYPWLCTLLDAYAIINAGTSHLIEEEAKKDTHLACKEGCYYCCVEPIPSGPLESLGLAFAARYYLQGDAKEKLQKQLLEQNGNPQWNNGTCPFLVDNTCAIYHLRPIACRNYLAFNSPCYLKEGGPVIFYNELKNYRIPSQTALTLANMHITQTCKEVGLFHEENKIISFENTRNLYIDVRQIQWLTNDSYIKFFGE